ncbi:protein FAM149B1 isoform X1 [Takifugu flavidus]|uniref:protein FAM149B1 isoform X1 n=1 Tax=Takifugu flavidus TaxID=433684 RepID=UPI0025448376|nr:protein FAM149B1 isoform X1 [Takifugu flavidus]XP_056902699.1 protein FAM149B1 isoform X1 [Takifugu flavidus]XP_056902701.1 protein FAM149B1 isoform X1 [Takifugu flavidus]XP_056902702.1 protein FAM149B1 isoform X1 [Takifugu flavidus]XP_056902703.1 protein FAM149B1 isoform X1 [Takifugu flavidus]XP_056902704.1 protein FAM149B1 isoform X1 [Takifugu flavidus]XP_056902705.1 protein FAM149B1 isoform X1 [Takifugu flavidus]XP_056902707.1 protein FAM149B1 isoform X1 [Takifugu flavidus]XP_05690270
MGQGPEGRTKRREFELVKRTRGRMITRYNRRPVSHKLEIRGLSRSRLDNHPLPEEADDSQTSQHYLHDLQETGSIHNSSETSAASGHSDCPTIISVDSNQSWSGIRSSTGTGISTERSSVFSWGYDEFDKAASRQVQQMFEEIDKELYEGRGGGAGILQGLQDECQQWATRFPHLRIVGTQVVCPGDEGFQWYATSDKSSLENMSAAKGSSTWSPHKDKGIRDLNVQGRRAAFLQSSSAQFDGSSSGSHSQHMQRVIEIEGLMEEYLAFDSRDLDDECEQDNLESAHRHHCLPPVSPYRCHRQAVLDLLFDDVWQQLVGWMKELVQHQWESCTSAKDKISGSLNPARQDSQNSFMLLSMMPTMLPKVGHSRVPPITAGQHFQNTKSGGSKHKSSRKSKKQKRPSSAGRVPAGASTTQHNLNDLIVIHSIPLQQRNLSLLDRNQDTEERQGHRSGSNTIPSSRPQPRRSLEQSSSSLSRPPQSARRRNPPPRTLLPLVPSSSLTGSIDEVIRGTRLPTVSDRLASPLLALSRNTLLPPISSGDLDTSQLGQQSKPAQRQKGPSSRAHSALNDQAGGVVLRDRHHLLDIFSRPNTTHTYRSDTPYRRSFTVLDNINQGRPGRASVATDSLGIGVTGVSLGITSSSFLDSFSHHPLGHMPIQDEEEPDPQVPGPAPVVPVSVPPRAYNRGGVSSRTSRHPP